MSDCNHIVGYGMRDYVRDIIRADDDGDEFDSRYSFSAFNYCPKCGKEISQEVLAVESRIADYWDVPQEKR